MKKHIEVKFSFIVNGFEWYWIKPFKGAKIEELSQRIESYLKDVELPFEIPLLDLKHKIL